MIKFESVVEICINMLKLILKYKASFLITKFSCFISIIQSILMFVRLTLKILITAEPIGLYSFTGPLVVLSYFHGGWDLNFISFFSYLIFFFNYYKLGAKPLVCFIQIKVYFKLGVTYIPLKIALNLPLTYTSSCNYRFCCLQDITGHTKHPVTLV